jgi:hypothetical protein
LVQSEAQVAFVSPQSQRPLPQAAGPQAAQLPLLQNVPEAHDSGSAVHWQPTTVPPQTGVAPEQALQVGPHLFVELHAEQVPPLQ